VGLRVQEDSVNKRNVVGVVLAVLAGVLLAGTIAAAAPRDEPGKVLTGRVTDRGENPLAGAVVYLTNTRTRTVKTYIAGREGEYRFPGLTANTDYEVYAQYQGHRSDNKTVSQFDSRPQININLKIDVR
jgi:hypothetical protein